ncbi:hypothetical protein ES705_32497 [subsurface metagenome]
MGVTTLPATDIGNTKATLNGNIEDNGGECTERGFLYKEGEEGAEHSISEEGDFPNGNYGLVVTGLKVNTLYYFKAWAKNVIETVYADDWESFTTILPTVTTQTATDIGNIRATLNGEAINFEGEITEYGFQYWKDGDVQIHTVKAEGTFYNMEFNLIAGIDSPPLTHNTKYIFKAYAKSSAGTFWGEELSFTTTNILPTVTTQIATDIESTSVTGNGTIVDGGGLEDCIERGFEVKYEFSGSLAEYDAWVGHGFVGEVIYNSGTDKWEGTLTKSYQQEGVYPAPPSITILFDFG